MKYVVMIAAAGILLLEWTDSIPRASVGGPMVVGFAYLFTALVFGIAEAWENRRGVLGWIVNIVVSLVGAFVTAPLGGMVLGILLSSFVVPGRSLAGSGHGLMSVALVGGLLVTLAGSWAALKLVNRWR
jgi:uncharacterized membrane protein YeaQ/YmgE (transglycosylase-associated protein family)